MKRSLSLLSALVFLVSFAANAISSTTAADAASMTPAKFVSTIGQVGLLEIALGKVSKKNSTNPEVKEFGAYMVKSHTQIGKWLKKAASEQKIKVPQKLNSSGTATLNKLSGLKGTAFDTTYIPAMVEGHTEVLAMLKKFAATTSDQGLKKFAQRIIPIIAMHLQHAKMVLADLKKNGEL